MPLTSLHSHYSGSLCLRSSRSHVNSALGVWNYNRRAETKLGSLLTVGKLSTKKTAADYFSLVLAADAHKCAYAK